MINYFSTISIKKKFKKKATSYCIRFGRSLRSAVIKTREVELLERNGSTCTCILFLTTISLVRRLQLLISTWKFDFFLIYNSRNYSERFLFIEMSPATLSRIKRLTDRKLINNFICISIPVVIIRRITQSCLQ